MRTIWKAGLQLEDQQEISVPQGAQFLHVAEQHGGLAIWFMCDPEPDRPHETRTILIRGTGHAIPRGALYIGTAQMLGGELVWHVFVSK